MEQSESIFANIHQKDCLGFSSPQGLKYDEVASFLNLEKSDVSKIAGVSKVSVRYDDRIPKEVQEHLEQIANICLLVGEYFNGDAHKTALWFKIPNPLFGNISPRDMIRYGRYKKVLSFVVDAITDN